MLPHRGNSLKTTITLDDDVAEFLKEQSRFHNKHLDQVVNETLRRGMSIGSQDYYKVVPTMSGFARGFDPKNIKWFLEEEDIEHYLRVSKE